MRISSKSRHAITSMLELARGGSEKSMTLANLAEEQNISLSYLEQIFADLRTKGLVKGRRGPGGGYMLARDVAEISIVDIICAVDEWVDYSFNIRSAPVVNNQTMTASGLWNKFSHELYEYLAGISLAGILQEDNAVESSTMPDFAAQMPQLDQAA